MPQKEKKDASKHTVIDAMGKIDFRLDADCKKRTQRLTFFGVLSVSEYSFAYLEIKTKIGTICVSGSDLRLTIMGKGLLDIVGCIEGITIRNAKNS